MVYKLIFDHFDKLYKKYKWDLTVLLFVSKTSNTSYIYTKNDEDEKYSDKSILSNINILKI